MKQARKQTNPDGTSIETFPDGRIVQTTVDGTKLEVFPGGHRVQTNVDGTTIHTAVDGSRIQRNPDGSSLEVRLDGSRLQTNLDGVTIQVFEDGTRIQCHPNGSRIEVSATGVTTTKTNTSPPGVALKEPVLRDPPPLASNPVTINSYGFQAQVRASEKLPQKQKESASALPVSNETPPHPDLNWELERTQKELAKTQSELLSLKLAHSLLEAKLNAANDDKVALEEEIIRFKQTPNSNAAPQEEVLTLKARVAQLESRENVTVPNEETKLLESEQTKSAKLKWDLDRIKITSAAQLRQKDETIASLNVQMAQLKTSSTIAPDIATVTSPSSGFLGRLPKASS